MGDGKKIGIRMAKANTEDIDAAFELAGLLEALERGFYPAREGDEDAPTDFDESNREHLEYLHERLTEIARKGSLFRVVGGLDTLLSPNNAIVDPEDDCIALHPRFAQVAKVPEQTGGFTPWGWTCIDNFRNSIQFTNLQHVADKWIADGLIVQQSYHRTGASPVGVDGLGLREADRFMETHYHRVMTFTAQPNNIEASRFSSAFRAARLGGDSTTTGCRSCSNCMPSVTASCACLRLMLRSSQKFEAAILRRVASA